jgi:cyclophilin family peptidyl-prolyl cis-trans isomerase
MALPMSSTPSSHVSNRKTFIEQVVSVSTISATAAFANPAGAASDQPQITHKVFFDVRISRSDGTFYVRDPIVNGQATGDSADEPFYGQLVFGLYGTKAPNHVKQFLNYVDVPYEIDNPLPSYSRSRFTTLDISSGLLIGGVIPGLDVTTLAGGSVLEYGGRVLPAKLWLEEIGVEKLSHSKKGLLTHRDLDVTPTFGITTIGSSTALDSSHTVFGCVLEDKGGFLNRVLDVPVLTDSGKVSRTEMNAEDVEGVGESIASSLFTAQRKVFRDAAKTFGDSRLEKVYDGKLLRRIDVSKVGVI